MLTPPQTMQDVLEILARIEKQQQEILSRLTPKASRKYLTVEEAAGRLDRSAWTVRQLCNLGLIRPSRAKTRPGGFPPTKWRDWRKTARPSCLRRKHPPHFCLPHVGEKVTVTMPHCFGLMPHPRVYSGFPDALHRADRREAMAQTRAIL